MRHAFETYVHVPGVIGIRTNIPGFRWGFGECKVPASENAFDSCKLKVFLEARKDRNVFADTDIECYTGVFRDFKAKPQRKAVVFEKKLGPVSLRFSVSVQGDCVHAVVGKSYLRLVRLKLMYIHPIAYVLFDLISLLLLQQNMTTFYGAAAELPGGRTVVCAAAPNTGKSLTVLQLQNKYGARILAEDMAVTNGESLWGAPYTGLYRNYHDDSLKTDQDNPNINLFAQRIDAVFLLQKGAQNREVEPESFLHQLLLINRYSLGYYYSPCVRVLDYYNQDMDVHAAQLTEEQILGRMVGTSQRRILERQNSMDFAHVLYESMAEEDPLGES